MDQLEQLVQDTLRAYADDAPGVEHLKHAKPTPPARRPRWLAMGAAAGIVAGLATVLVAVGHHHPQTRARHAAATLVAPPPTGPQQIVSYHGVQITVPARLPIITFRCGAPQVDMVFLDNHLGHSCPAVVPETSPPGLTTAILSAQLPDSAPPPASTTQRIANTPISLAGGVDARIGYRTSPSGVLGVLVVPASQVVIAVTTPTKTQTDTLLATVRTMSTDQHGCRAHVSSLTPTGNPPRNQLVPPGPVSATVCQYLLGDHYASYSQWLLHSERLSASRTQKLAAALNALPEHAPSSRVPHGINDLVTFSYPDGTTRTIRALAYGLGDTPLATDGRRTVIDTDGTVAQLLFP